MLALESFGIITITKSSFLENYVKFSGFDVLERDSSFEIEKSTLTGYLE